MSPGRLIWSEVEEETVLVVPGRAQLDAQADRQIRSTPHDCPFCPGGEEWDANCGPRPRLVASKHPMIGSSTAEPNHYVVVYGVDHDRRLGRADLDVVAAFFEVLAGVTDQLYRRSDVLSVFAFESVGDHFGPTVAHPHGQVIGLPFVPRRLLVGGKVCFACNNLTDDNLIVHADSDAIVGVSPWARLPYEMVVVPRRHVCLLAELDVDERVGLARACRMALSLANEGYGDMPPYLLNVMQPPPGSTTAGHLRVEIVPLHRGHGVLKRPGAMELGLGVYINPIDPVQAATHIRSSMRTVEQ